MILSGMSCFAGIIAGIMSFTHFSSFERFNRSFAAGIMFFISKCVSAEEELVHARRLQKTQDTLSLDQKAESIKAVPTAPMKMQHLMEILLQVFDGLLDLFMKGSRKTVS
ncbi:hypothetical protein XENOCAPTIV_026054 [Xenoophorus captivus]|uniref:Uncharacterized protein n=1 Tax=Xenoophorus captivus TaxID=1517983 RepID=A0ABV0QWN5_9TELE